MKSLLHLPHLALGLLFLTSAFGGLNPARAAHFLFHSPDGSLVAQIHTNAAGRLSWNLRRGSTPLVPASPLGLTVEGIDLGLGVTLGTPQQGRIDETYPWRGAKSVATHRCLTYSLPVRHTASGTAWHLEVRAFDDGVAYRYRVPGSGTRRVESEASAWNLPARARAWFQSDTRNYEGAYTSSLVGEIPTELPTERGPQPHRLGPPVTVELADDGFLLLTEAALFRYSGMSLRPGPEGRLSVVFEDDPRGFELTGEILTPWRVTMAVPDLNALVNSDLIPNLAPPPDADLFPEGMRTAWIRPGRALITWCVFGNEGARWTLQKWFVDQCAALHCEYLLVDAGWRSERWGWLANGGDVWARLRELCDYAASRGVGIVVWHSYPEGRDDGPGLTRPEARRELLDRCRDAGVRGIKIDFFDSESLEIIEVQEELARLAAERRLTINFHGAHKPTGEVRTWPNEVTREGIREQEYLLWDRLPLEHYAALPFTRMAVGHSDFLPTYVRAKYLRNTTAVFQLATAILATSSFVCWPDHPDDYRVSPCLGILQAMPVVWDETRILPGSKIGEAVVMARRSGADWFLMALRTRDPQMAVTIDLSFLSDGEFTATVFSEGTPPPTGVATETGRPVQRGDTLSTRLDAGQAWVAWLRPAARP